VNDHWFQINLDALFWFHASFINFDQFIAEKNAKY
jgi:hypothetical protein